jgi:hypothetical protein
MRITALPRAERAAVRHSNAERKAGATLRQALFITDERKSAALLRFVRGLSIPADLPLNSSMIGKT